MGIVLFTAISSFQERLNAQKIISLCTESSDYTRFSGVYTFSLPDQQSSIEIQIINDTILEEKEEQFLVEFFFLSDFVPILVVQEQAIVTIRDDDSEFMHKVVRMSFDYITLTSLALYAMSAVSAL